MIGLEIVNSLSMFSLINTVKNNFDQFQNKDVIFLG